MSARELWAGQQSAADIGTPSDQPLIRADLLRRLRDTPRWDVVIIGSHPRQQYLADQFLLLR